MQFSSILLMLLVVFLVLLTTIVIATAGHHFLTARTLERRRQLAETLRPRISRLVVDEDADMSDLIDQDGLEDTMIDEVAEILLSKLRGSDRERLRSLLTQRGTLDEARRDLSNPRSFRRVRSAELLAASQADEFLPGLISLLHDRRSHVRETAAMAIGRMGDPEAVPDLLSALVDGRRPIPGHLVRMALYRIGHPAADALIDALEHDSAAIRLCAAETVGHLGIDDAVPSLATLVEIESNDDVALAAVDALIRIGTPRSSGALDSAAVDAELESARDAARAHINRSTDNVIVLPIAS